MTDRLGVLIVGGAGFLGRAVIERLIEDIRWQVHVLARKQYTDLPQEVVFHQGDQGDSALVRPLLEQCSFVIHLAAAAIPADTVWTPLREVEANLLPALRFLECAQDFPGNRYVYVSSGGAIYGNALFASELTPLRPTSYHGCSKVALEGFFGVLGQRFPGCLTILRPSNVYGPGQALRSGFGVIRTLLERARDGGCVTVFGDGSAVRDYLFIDDLVAACLAAMHGTAGTYNIGAGRGTSLNTLLSLIEQVTGCHLQVERKPARASDVAQIGLDIRAACEHLEWIPAVALEEGLRRTWGSLL